MRLFNQASTVHEGNNPPVGQNPQSCILLEVIRMIHKDYRSAVDALIESIDILTKEIVTLKGETPHP